MKNIEILLENGVSLVCKDEDTSELESFANNLTGLLSSKKVSILSTSDGSTFILKPSKILSIKVTEDVITIKSRQKKSKVEIHEPLKIEDYISDK
jgi:hypothetical protein